MNLTPELTRILTFLHWTSRRYCDGRQTGVVSTFNDIARQLISMGVELDLATDGTPWARDGGGRDFDGLTREEAAMGRPPHDSAADHERRHEQALAVLAVYAEEYGGIHDEACPHDDTCSCEFVARTNEVLKGFKWGDAHR